MSHKNCHICNCELFTKAKKFIATSTNEDDKALVKELVNTLLSAEEDADFWKNKFQGKWPETI